MLLKSPFPYKSISEGCNFLSGFAFKSKDFSDEGIPVVKIKNIQNNKVDFKDSQFYPESLFQLKLDKFKVFHKDVLIAMTGQGSVGRVGQVKIGKDTFGLLNQRVGKFLCDEQKLNRDYLFYLLTSERYQNHLFDKAVGSGQPNLSPTDITSVEIPFPNYKEQKSIASILSTLDDKIELNLQMNKTLEEMAMALYKHWFVDFGPFQDGEFVDSELGEIPKGWEVRSIYSVANFINGAAFKPKDLLGNNEEGLPVIKIVEIKQGITAQTKYSNKNLDDKYTISNGDILFPWSGNPHTSLGIHIWDKGNALLNQHIFVVRTEDTAQKCFVFNLLKYQLPTFIHLATHKQTTGLGHITVANLKELPIAYPSKEAIEQYNEEGLPIFELIYNNQLENISLTQLRDTLLPKLISGEVRVEDVEKTLSEVL